MNKKFLLGVLILAGSALMMAGCGKEGKHEAEALTTPTLSPTPTDTPTPTVTPTPTPITRVYDMDEYVAQGILYDNKKAVTIDISGLKSYVDANNMYRVTVLFEDGTYVQKDMPESFNDSIVLAFDQNIKAAEATPIFKISFGKDRNTEEDGWLKVNYKDVFDNSTDRGFIGYVDSDTNGIALKKTDSYFCFGIPDGRYEITVTKGEDARTTLMVDDGAFAVNVGINGTDRKGSDRTYTARDVVTTGGVLRFSVSGSPTISSLVLVRESQLIPRKTHIYIAGDSTVATYYPRTSVAEPADGTAQTGWGQLFAGYTTEDVIVDGLGAGGTYAKSWYELCFRGILNNACEGDVFIIQEGINDRTYSSTEEMVEYLTIMIDKCLEKKVVPVLVTSQQTAKFWKDSEGNQLGEYDEPQGGGLYPFAAAIRDLAASKNVFLVDNAKLTAEWYKKVGYNYVERTYHLYNQKQEKSVDSLHSSYAGSKKIAELIATDIASKIAAGATDGYGNTLDALKLNDLVTYTFEYTGSTGKTVREYVRAVEFKN